MRHSLILVLLAVPLLVLPQSGAAQKSFSDSSGLARPAYVRDRIHEISDADLWGSLDLARPGLERVREAAGRGNSTAAAEAWGAYWRGKKSPSYITQTDHLFLDTDLLTDTAQFRAALEKLPEERDTILARAAMILRGAIRPWGDTTIQFGEHVDFDREVGASGKYGFHYWMWSRPLIMAYVLTRDQRYTAGFDRLFNQWYEQRNAIHSSIPGLDVVYYELGLGMRNRMFIENYMLPFSARTPETHLRMLKTILAAGRWLYELERWEGYRPGNWQVHGSYMLIQMALVFPEFRESSAWLAIGLQRLLEHMRDDFYADGGHSERAPRNYTLATYLNYRNVAYLLDAYGARRDVRSEIQAALGKTIDWWLTMIAPTGEVPAINDSHRGLFPASILRDGARLFDTPEAYGVLRNLFGEPGHETAPLPQYVSRNMPASGFCVMRTDWTPEALYMTVNYGPAAGFHTHFDLLDFEMYAYGTPLAIDAGVGLTYDDPLYNPWYRSSRAHNMVTVNDSSIEREGMRGEHILWDTAGALEYFSGEQSGYRRFGVHQRRQIAFVKPSYWFVLDDIHCEKSGDTLSWYIHTPGKFTQTGAGFSSTAETGIAIMPAGDVYATRTGMGWAASPSIRIPGKTEKIPWIRFDQVSRKDSTHQFAVVLSPTRPGKIAPSATRVSGRHFTVQSGGATDHLYFTNGRYADGSVKTDAEFLILRIAPDGARRYALIEGTYIEYRGKRLFTSPHAVSREGVLPP
ncbi:MAG TPA: alginate lyase family protein [Bacteroidota bacterium]|nr:alginate lyase family protein [Bacteroidota bacterium]